jgi:integrase
MTVAEYLERKARRSEATKLTYSKAELAFAKCFGVKSADIVVRKVKAHKLDKYKALDKFVGYLIHDGKAPKTVLVYVTAVKGLMRYEKIKLDKYDLQAQVELPDKVEVSMDRLPTREEMRAIILNSDRRTRALVSLLATSGLRVGEVASLRIGEVDFLKNKITLMAARTKTKKSRFTYFSDETAQFLREYLGERVNRKDEWLFPAKGNPEQHTNADAAYMDVYRVLRKLGLLGRMEGFPESKRNQLHPHCFRKYFFSKLIGKGVDRGIAEGFMGHTFGLDGAYLLLPEDQLKAQYMKAADDFTFLSEPKLDTSSKQTIETLQKDLRNMAIKVDLMERALKSKA